MEKQGKMALAAAAGLLIILMSPRSGAVASAGSAVFLETPGIGVGVKIDERAYYSVDGLRLVNTWVKSADGKNAYYLDEDGIMATNRMITYGDGVSYVDETGAQVRNGWAALPNDGLWNEPVKTVYYYLGSNGKAFQDVKKRIDGKTYVFDSEGHMLSGWYEDNGDYYYLGTEDEGWVHVGWQQLTPENLGESNSLEQWYYFRPNSGKANRGRKKVNGSFYYFDQDTAAAQTGWIEWGNQHAYYDPATGRMMTGWVYCQGPEDGEEGWYYLDKDGVPFNYRGKDSGDEDRSKYYGKGIDYIDVDAFEEIAAMTLQGDTYLFDKNGKMMTGQFYLWLVKNKGGKTLGASRVEDGTTVTGAGYFFDNQEGPSLGKMLKGRQKETVDGMDYDYYFDDNGKAYMYYIVDGHLYGEDGTRIKAEHGDKYKVVGVGNFHNVVEVEKILNEPVRIKGKSRKLNDCLLIVDRNGKVKKNGKVKINGYRYTVKDYIVVGTPEEID